MTAALRLVSFHFTLRDAAGRVADTSRGGKPVDFVEGRGQIIEGLEEILLAMTSGEKREISVPPELGYGRRDEGLVQKVARSQLPVAELRVGDRFQTGPDRQAPIVTVVGVNGDEVVLDANHPLAGQELLFEVELVAVRAATPEEESREI